MRNLKRALSLALASVMLLGMMVVGTSAASYPDVDENDNVEAIEVLNAVKVMIGDRGNFAPDRKVTRNDMAVIMAKLYLGSDEADSYVGSHPFTDVVPWADKYVAACYENGLISGTSSTTYSGGQPLTAVQAALMMLRALGYEELNKGASDWRAPVTAKANEIRLFKGVASSPSAQLTRNDVAQLVLNTLEADVVVSDIEKDIIVEGIVTIPGKVTYNKVEDKGNLNYNSASVGTSDQIYLQLCEKLYDGKLTLRDVGGDNYGRPGKGWKYKTNDVIATRDDSPILTYTDSAKAADVTKDLKGYTSPVTGDGVKICVDGRHTGSAFDSISDIATAINSASGKGVTVTVYANDAKKITDVVAINTYIGQVTKVKTEKDETTVTVSKKAGGPESANTFETDAFEKDDYVIYTVGSDGIETMELAEKATGKVTATSTDYLRLDGTKYDYAKYTANKDGAPAVKDEFDLYLAADGSIVYTAKVEGAADQYLYVKGADLYFDTISIRAVFADGTTKIVSLSGDTRFDSNAVVASGGTKLSDMTPASEDAESLVGDVYKYTEDGDTVKLTSAGYADAAEVTAVGAAPAAGAIKAMKSAAANSGTNGHLRFAIEKNNATLFTTEATNGSGTWSASASNNAPVVANNDTVYVLTSNGTTYTGFRNVPSMTSVNLTYVTNKDNASLVDLVFISAKTDGADENASYFYIKDSAKYEEEDGCTVWKEAYVNGEKTDVVTKGAHGEAGAGAVITAAGVYKAVKTNDKDQITEVTSVIAKTAITGVQAEVASAQTLKLTAANPVASPLNIATWSYDSETVFVSIDKDGDVTADTSVPSGIAKKSSLEAGDSVYYIAVTERKGGEGKDATTAKVVYVVEAEADTPTAPTVKIAGGDTNGIKTSEDAAWSTATALTTSTNADITVTFADGSKDTVKFTIDNDANTGTTATVTLKVGSADAASYEAGEDKDIGASLDSTGINLVLKVTVSGGTFATTEFTYTVKLKTA